jgi:signal transduction histidine kinase
MIDLTLIAGLCDPYTRHEAAKKLAESIGATYFLVFIYDPEVNIVLPGPGFIQTLKNMDKWHSFLKGCHLGWHSGQIPFPDEDNPANAFALAGPDGSVAVIIGGHPLVEDFEPIKQLLPLLSALLKKEQEQIANKSLALIAENSARKAVNLAHTLELIRLDLRKALIKQKEDKEAIELLLSKKDEFMNIASHELKTPLTSMKSYIQLIARRISTKFPDKQLMDYIERANIQTEKLILLVNDLFDLSKIQNGLLKFNLTRFDFVEIVRDCIWQIQNSTETHTIFFDCDFTIEINGDRHRLEQVVCNLLSNAIKYSPDADHVLVQLKKDEHTLQLKITDYGIGIPENDIPNISQRFFRVDAITRKINGLGLGLYISSQIINGHGGKMDVESKLNHGSTFKVTFPLNCCSTEEPL